jgi:hypothetical protein
MEGQKHPSNIEIRWRRYGRSVGGAGRRMSPSNRTASRRQKAAVSFANEFGCYTNGGDSFLEGKK